MIGRRGFLKIVGASVLGLSLAIRTAERKIDLRPSYEPGISMRFVQRWDVATPEISRIDVLYGWGVIQPEFAVRLTDTPWYRRWW
jgi:hypothetical protein